MTTLVFRRSLSDAQGALAVHATYCVDRASGRKLWFRASREGCMWVNGEAPELSLGEVVSEGAVGIHAGLSAGLLHFAKGMIAVCDEVYRREACRLLNPEVKDLDRPVPLLQGVYDQPLGDLQKELIDRGVDMKYVYAPQNPEDLRANVIRDLREALSWPDHILEPLLGHPGANHIPHLRSLISQLN